MTYTVSPPIRPQYKDTMLKMRPRTDIFFLGANADSIKSVASRLSIAGRRYITRREETGVRVWRIA